MQGKFLNIPSYIDDPSYRYQMPALQLKIEGKGNGIKTNIVNLADVSKALRVPTEYPLKFLGHELGTLTLYKEVKHEITSIINGAFSEEELKRHMDKFIEKYILCPNCKYPEMVLRVRKEKVCGSCNSCGAKPILDNNHKLATFILKNPPKNNSEFKKEAEKEKEEKESKSKKTGKGDKSEKDSKPSKKGGVKEDDSEEQKSNSTAISTSTGSSVTKSTFNPANIGSYAQQIQDEYNKHKDLTSFEDKNDEIGSIISLIKSFKFPDDQKKKLSNIVFSSIFTLNIAKEIQKNKALLEAFWEELEIGEREPDLLLNLEEFLFSKHKDVTWEKYIPTILKLFYDEDLLSEEFLLEWDDKKHDEELRKDARFNQEVDDKFKAASKDILEWLRSSD